MQPAICLRAQDAISDSVAKATEEDPAQPAHPYIPRSIPRDIAMLEFENEEHADRYAGKCMGSTGHSSGTPRPERLGRCGLEIPAVLGVGQENWSDWDHVLPIRGAPRTAVCFSFRRGASVWAEFEGGDASTDLVGHMARDDNRENL